MKSHETRRTDRTAAPKAAAFTLIELLVCIFIITILAALLLPALAAAHGQAHSVFCRNNTKQLTTAWIMYVGDYDGSLPPNYAGTVASYDLSWLPGNPQLTITDYAIRRGLLYPYAPNPEAYRCPTDHETIEINKRKYKRAVNYGLNIYLNGGTVRRSAEELFGHAAVTRESQILRPSRSFVFLEEDPDGNGNTQFSYYPVGVDKWISFPADRHGRGCNISFADGHVEHWKWHSKKENRYKMEVDVPVHNELDRKDLDRLQQTVPDGNR